MRTDGALACADSCSVIRQTSSSPPPAGKLPRPALSPNSEAARPAGGAGVPLAGDRGGRSGKRRRLRVVLADDHVVVRQGLKSLLEREGFAVVAEASNGFEAIRLTQHFRPDVAVLDFDMPLMNGIDAVTEILRHSPKTRTILLTADTGHQHLPEALQAGMRGFVLKNHAVAHLVRAIREVTRGGVYVSPSVATTVARVSLAKTDVPPDRLTRRERQVLQLIAEGKKTKEIAALLGIKIKTAETHRSRIMRRVNIHGTANLVRYALRGGLTRL